MVVEEEPVSLPDPPPQTPSSADQADGFVIASEVLSLGLDYDTYRSGCERHVEVMDEVYSSPAYTAEDLDRLSRLPPLQIIVIAEDWCVDVNHTLPTWVRIAKQLPGWSYRIFRRDEHPALMDRFVQASGARSLPVYAFLDRHDSLLMWWSGRGREAQQEVDRLLAGRRFVDLSATDRKAVSGAFERRYLETFRRSNFLEILTLLNSLHP